jgi:hypothetical protein
VIAQEPLGDLLAAEGVGFESMGDVFPKRLDVADFFDDLAELQADHPPFSPGLADKIRHLSTLFLK